MSDYSTFRKFTVDRYDVSSCGDMNCEPLVASHDGAYVAHEDYEALLKEAERLSNREADLSRLADARHAIMIDLQNQLDQLKAENERLRKNADRYQHLRKVGLVLEGHDFISFDEIADYRIDVAMAKAAQ